MSIPQNSTSASLSTTLPKTHTVNWCGWLNNNVSANAQATCGFIRLLGIAVGGSTVGNTAVQCDNTTSVRMLPRFVVQYSHWSSSSSLTIRAALENSDGRGLQSLMNSTRQVGEGSALSGHFPSPWTLVRSADLSQYTSVAASSTAPPAWTVQKSLATVPSTYASISSATFLAGTRNETAVVANSTFATMADSVLSVTLTLQSPLSGSSDVTTVVYITPTVYACPLQIPLAFTITFAKKPSLLSNAAITAVDVVSSVASLTTMSPATAINANRLASLRRQINCEALDTEGSLDTLSNLIGISFGPVVGQYYRGAVVSAVVMVCAGIIFMVGLLVVVHTLRKLTQPPERVGSLYRSACEAGIPSLLVMPVAVVLQPAFTAGVVLLQIPQYAADYLLAVLVLIPFSLYLVHTWYVTFLQFRGEVVWFSSLPPNREDEGLSAAARLVKYLLEPRGDWRARGRVREIVNLQKRAAAKLSEGEEKRPGILMHREAYSVHDDAASLQECYNATPLTISTSNVFSSESGSDAGEHREEEMMTEHGSSGKEEGSDGEWAEEIHELVEAEDRSSDGIWMHSYVHYYSDYHIAWYNSFELTSAFFVGALEGVITDSVIICQVRSIMELALFTFLFIFPLLSGLALIRTNQFLICLINGAALLAASFLVVNSYDEQDVYDNIVTMSSFLGMIFSVVKSFIDVVSVVLESKDSVANVARHLRAARNAIVKAATGHDYNAQHDAAYTFSSAVTKPTASSLMYDNDNDDNVLGFANTTTAALRDVLLQNAGSDVDQELNLNQLGQSGHPSDSDSGRAEVEDFKSLSIRRRRQNNIGNAADDKRDGASASNLAVISAIPSVARYLERVGIRLDEKGGILATDRAAWSSDADRRFFVDQLAELVALFEGDEEALEEAMELVNLNALLPTSNDTVARAGTFTLPYQPLGGMADDLPDFELPPDDSEAAAAVPLIKVDPSPRHTSLSTSSGSSNCFAESLDDGDSDMDAAAMQRSRPLHADPWSNLVGDSVFHITEHRSPKTKSSNNNNDDTERIEMTATAELQAFSEAFLIDPTSSSNLPFATRHRVRGRSGNGHDVRPLELTYPTRRQQQEVPQLKIGALYACEDATYFPTLLPTHRDGLAVPCVVAVTLDGIFIGNKGLYARYISVPSISTIFVGGEKPIHKGGPTWAVRMVLQSKNEVSGRENEYDTLLSFNTVAAARRIASAILSLHYSVFEAIEERASTVASNLVVQPFQGGLEAIMNYDTPFHINVRSRDAPMPPTPGTVVQSLPLSPVYAPFLQDDRKKLLQELALRNFYHPHHIDSELLKRLERKAANAMAQQGMNTSF